MMRKICLYIIGILAVMAAGNAEAAHDLYEKLDADNDGIVVQEELAEDMIGGAFNKMDTDKDRRISREEWRRTHDIVDGGKEGELFRLMDEDADDRISFPEFSDYAKKYSNIEDAFMILDKNRDGALAPDEISYVPRFRLFTVRF